MNERLLTPSKITAWLECGHFLTLRNQADAGVIEVTQRPMGSLADLLVEKGTTHERDCLSDLEKQGKSVYSVPGRNPNENFAQWVERVSDTLDKGYDVIYQMPFIHEGIRGIADFLLRVDAEDGFSQYEPIDAKLTRSEGKPGHVLQLCFYSDAIRALTGKSPEKIHLWLGSGEMETLVAEQYAPYWRRLRLQLAGLLNEETPEATSPEPCSHCEMCEFADRCEKQWREADSLIYVANIRPSERQAFAEAGIATLVELSTRNTPVADVHDEKLQRLTRQAALQVQSRTHPDDLPAFELVEATEDPVYGHGFSLMPEPNEGDIFFDFEGHPFWTAKDELFFLSGLYLVNENGEWGYDAIWAHNLEQQKKMIKDLVEFFSQRREQYPNYHVYHYNHTERSSLERLTAGTESEVLFAHLIEGGLFVDLYNVARNALAVGTESYGLKHLEKLSGFTRHGDIEGGAGAVVEYEEWMKTGDAKILDSIAGYNDDDVQATKALRDWLIGQRPIELEWREPVMDVQEYELDTDELVERLKNFGEDSPEALLADLLNYWRRERSAYTTPKFIECASDFGTLYDNPEFIANLSLISPIESTHNRTGSEIKQAIFTWSGQSLSPAFTKQVNVLFTGVGVEHGYGYIKEFDLENRTLTMTWPEPHDASGSVPSVLTIDDYVSPRDKPGVLFHLAEQILDGTVVNPPNPVSMALLAGAPPKFTSGNGPKNGLFSEDLDEMQRWAVELDESYVAIQGPPGTGKTYSGSHIIYSLIKAGKRVGITAMSHAAIDNLMNATYELFKEHDELHLVQILRQGSKPKEGALSGVKYNPKGEDLESSKFNLLAGTTWMWSRPGLRAYPVDVLVVDEAGQLALADAIAATNAARNLILLGDPLQLAHVSQAEHPNGSGASVLEHVLKGHATIAPSDGVFISVTRRMHPDVCAFISGQIYEGRLTSHASCAVQNTDVGTGLRWLNVEHEGCSTESQVEADVVAAQIKSMIGSKWTNQKGEQWKLEPRDFMVVAPYNDQVNLIKTMFSRDEQLRGVQVGTVDKFQGQEAPVVFFTMTTSTAEDMPRGPEFLFSRNRLNVAISRARCLAFLVCTDELLNARARDIEEMRLIATLSAFVEYVQATN